MSALMTEEQHAVALAQNLPTGRVWIPKLNTSSNLYKFLLGLAPTFQKIDASLQRMIAQSIPTTTDDYLEEWEAALRIPDECLPLAADADTRRRNINIKLSILEGVATEQDFVDLAAMFGLVVFVKSGIDHLIIGDGGYGTALPALDISGPNNDFATVKQARFTMVVSEVNPTSASFDYDWDIPFSLAAQDEMRCLFTKLKPANCDILFVTAP